MSRAGTTAMPSRRGSRCGIQRLDLTGLAEGAKYDIAEINCTVPHDARFEGRSLALALRGPYDSAVFELRYAREL